MRSRSRPRRAAAGVQIRWANKMMFRLSRRQRIVFLCAAIAILIVAVFPTFGAPQFRYNGCDPEHHVWNLGWPVATCIYDAVNSPHFFVGPFAYVYALASMSGFAVFYAAAIAWNNRGLILSHRFPRILHTN